MRASFQIDEGPDSQSESMESEVSKDMFLIDMALRLRYYMRYGDIHDCERPCAFSRLENSIMIADYMYHVCTFLLTDTIAI